MSKIRVITCALAAAALFIGSQAGAQAPSQIFACVSNNNGSVRIVTQNTACQSNEHLVVWNVVGPQGAAGPAGTCGCAGTRGSPGPSRSHWRAGSSGTSGSDWACGTSRGGRTDSGRH